jgi:hypothetical protein
MAQGRPTCQEEKKDMLMTTLSAYLSNTVLSTAWMPLDGLIQEWGKFGAEHTSTAPALHAVGMAFCALSRETTARTYYTAAWHIEEDEDLTELEHTLEELLQARQYWTDAMISLELLLLDPHEELAFQDILRPLLAEVMEQRTRVALLIYQTQQEQLTAYRRAEFDPQQGVRLDWPATGKLAGQRARNQQHPDEVIGF